MQDEQMTGVFILSGTNLGDRRANLEFALTSLAEKATVVKTSSLFETEPVGFKDQAWFLNQAIEIDTLLMPTELLAFCQKIENAGGRVRSFANAPRTLDLDILFYRDLIINGEDLIIPHPRLTERKFVLKPLAQIAPEFVHPVLGKSIRALLDECPDRSEVRLADKIQG
jgi:2-amino-4-hydroxy-6-hydroxymethyldihydropteridine diphosphokinase